MNLQEEFEDIMEHYRGKGFPDSFILEWIEQKLKEAEQKGWENGYIKAKETYRKVDEDLVREAKIEENQRYIDTGVPPFDMFKPTFENRISELKGE